MTSITYLNFASHAELATNPDVLESLILGYQSVFGEPGPWEEHYTREEVSHKLALELSGTAALRVAVTGDAPTREVHSFSWAQLLQHDQINTAMNSIAYFANKAGERSHANDLAAMQSKLTTFAADPVIYLHDLGVAADQRGAADLEELVYPMLEALAEENRSRRIVFWTVAATSISWLAHKAEIPCIAKIGEMLIFSGEFPQRPTYEAKPRRRQRR